MKKWFLVSITAFMLGTQAAHADWQMDLQRAETAMTEGRYIESLNALDRVLQDNPNAWEAYLKRARVHAALGNHAQVVHNYNQVMTLHPRLEAAWAQRYQYFMQKGMLTQAEYDLSEGLRLLPRSPRLNYLQAMHLIQKQQNALALPYLENVLLTQPVIETNTSFDPLYLRSSAIRASMYQSMGQMEPYGRELGLLIAMSPREAELHWGRALWHYQHRQDMAAAKGDLNNYLYLAPRSAKGYALRAKINLAGNLCADALSDLKMACGLGVKNACYRKPPCEVPEEKAAPESEPGAAGAST